MGKMGRLFANGVSFYTPYHADIIIHFPENDVSCRWCKFCRTDISGLERYKCILTDRILYAPEFVGLPDFCPLLPVENQDENF